MQKKDIKQGVLLGILITIAALSRLVDHPMNFTPIAAIILFCTANISNNFLKVIIPLITILFSDLLLEVITGFGFHSGTWIVYLSYVLIFAIGFILLQKISVYKIVAASIIGSLIFFLLTNFALFYKEAAVANPLLGQYPHDFKGIIASYQAGMPFFRNTLIGDLFFNSILFGTYYFLKNFNFAFSKNN